MNLEINNHLFIVSGATSGFGKAIAQALLNEGANVIVVARGEDKLRELYAGNEQAELLSGDITDYGTIDQLEYMVGERQLHGMVVNAGGAAGKNGVRNNVAGLG